MEISPVSKANHKPVEPIHPAPRLKEETGVYVVKRPATFTDYAKTYHLKTAMIKKFAKQLDRELCLAGH